MSADTHLIEEYGAVDLRDISRGLGGWASLRRAESVELHLPAGDVLLQLVRVPSTLGRGHVLFMKCPRCARKARILRVAPVPEVLVCARCVRCAFKARYASQVRSRRSTARTPVRHGEGDDHGHANDVQ